MLQISSSLDWRSIKAADKPLQFVSQPYSSDIDHTGALSEAVVTLPEAILPKGTILRITAWHDNTAANPFNPDPDQWVGYGDRTVDEMAHAWMNVTYISDEDYAKWVAEHKPSAQTAR